MSVGAAVLELNDIQYIVLARAPALTGRYEFLSFRDGAAGRSARGAASSGGAPMTWLVVSHAESPRWT